MDNSCPRDVSQGRAIKKEAIEQRAAWVASRWVDNQSGWLVDDQYIVVFKADCQREGLSDPLALGVCCRGADLDLVVESQQPTRSNDLPIDQNRALLDPPLKSCSGVLG